MSAHWDEKKKKKEASTEIEQRAKCVISLGEACHLYIGGSPNMKGDGGETQRTGGLKLWLHVKMYKKQCKWFDIYVT